MFNILVLLATVLNVAAEVRPLPPITGKFFYMDFYDNRIEGMHGVKSNVGSKSSAQTFWITTHETRIGLISTKCSNVFVPRKFDVASSETAGQISTGTYKSETVNIYNSRDLLPVQYSGHEYRDNFTFQYNAWDR